MATESSTSVQESGARSSSVGLRSDGPDRPPDIARILDHAGAHQRGHIGVEFLAGAEQLRHAGARQLVIGGEPVALEPRAPRLPERRGGREREEQRQIGQHSIHHVDPLVRIGQLDMHVQPAQEIALADHLQVVHDGVVALFVGLLRAAPGGGRMRAGGENGEAVFGRHRGDGLAQMAQLRARIRHVDVGRGHHLDLRLQELRRDCGRRPQPWQPRRRPAACRARATSSPRRPGNIPLRFRT